MRTRVDPARAALVLVGIPLFGTLQRDIRLRHVATQQYPGGLVKSEYAVVA